MERASPFRALLAHRHASPLPRAENLGGVGPLDAGLAHGLALSPRAQGDLLEWPSAGGKVVQEACTTLPPAKDGTLYLVGDDSVKPKRGPQSPLTQKGRKSEHQPWFVGIRLPLLIATWDVYRLPVAFRVIRRKTDLAYQTENAWLREMVQRFGPPPWATRVIVAGDAAYGSQDTMQMDRTRDAAAPAWRWGLECAMARTWKTVEEKAPKDWVRHVPPTYSQRTRVSRLSGLTAAKPAGCIARACVGGTSVTSPWC